jgi:hypothetical protein
LVKGADQKQGRGQHRG